VWALLAFDSPPALLGSTRVVWGFGLRHTVDFDHIAAIENASRRLMPDGQRQIAVSLFFSLGHSTVVILAKLVVVLAQGWFLARFSLLGGRGGLAETFNPITIDGISNPA
jgi:high-affinity nickel-transport protein